MSKIEQLIDEIEEFIENCKPQAFSQSKVIVPKDELFELLTELRLKTPDEIKRYQKIIANKDQIISDAQAQAEKMLEETTAYTNSLVEEHEIMIKAYERAEELMNTTNAQSEATIAQANEDAENIRRSALAYAEELISNLEDVIAHTLETLKQNSDNLVGELSYNLGILSDNRTAIHQQLEEDAGDGEQAPQMQLDIPVKNEETGDTAIVNEVSEALESTPEFGEGEDFDYDDLG